MQSLREALRRAIRRARSGWRPAAATFVHHSSYDRGVSGLPVDPARAEKVLAFLSAEGLVRRRDLARPFPASLETILRVHTAAYLESLQDPRAVGEILGTELRDDEAQATLDLVRLMVGGTIQATRLALRTDRVAVNLGGGFHHAAPDRGMGFCIFNDVAVAVARLRARGYSAPILVVDLDLHDGNGTRLAFAADPTVYTVSIHNVTWDDRPAVADTTIALGSDVTDDRLLEVLERELPPVVEAHRPGLVVYVGGCDGAADDRIGDWRLTAEGLLRRDRFVVELVRGNGRSTPLAIVLGGGYGSSAWRYFARSFGWLLSGRVVEPPDDVAILLRRFRDIDRDRRTSPEAPQEVGWGLTEGDLFDVSPTSEPRFLDHYTRHGLELMLERLGLLTQLRARGYRRPVLTIDATAGLGQTLRIFGDPDRRALLVELRVSRRRRLVAEMDVLYVEWLLLQDPRSEFTERRPPLPGQRHPGLGILSEIAAWLVFVCERLGLDGIAFVPSHYFMAALGRRHLRFPDPALQARFEALADAVAGVDVGDASRAIDEEQVVDAANGEPVRWEPAPMVVPVSQKLRRDLEGAAYRTAVQRERARLRYRLRGGGPASAA